MGSSPDLYLLLISAPFGALEVTPATATVETQLALVYTKK
jgi:hypothetical protein